MATETVNHAGNSGLARAIEPFPRERAGELARDLVDAVETAVPPNHGGDGSRALVLVHSVLNLLEGEDEDEVVTWRARTLLEMLEDAMPVVENVQLVCEAIARLQEVLGVPADRRAWVIEDPHAEEASAEDLLRKLGNK